MNLENFHLKFDEAKSLSIFGEEKLCDEILSTVDSQAESIVGILYKVVFSYKGKVIHTTIGGKVLAETVINKFIESDFVCDNIVYA